MYDRWIVERNLGLAVRELADRPHRGWRKGRYKYIPFQYNEEYEEQHCSSIRVDDLERERDKFERQRFE